MLQKISNKELPAGLSFLICTYNGANRLAETLACLARQINPSGVKWEVILVDNASTDGTAEYAHKEWTDLGTPAPLRTFYEPRPGKQFAIETGVDNISYGIACIVDDDNRLKESYLDVGVSILKSNPKVGILGGRNSATFEGKEPEWFTAFQPRYAVGQQLDWANQGVELTEGDIGQNVLWGAGMFVRTAIWWRLRDINFKSLFSGRQGETNLTAGEDDELCYLCLFMGYEIWYSSRLELRHHMTAGRLSTTYRDQLFYAATRSMGRLSAYRNALWGKQSADAGGNFFKDLLYSVHGLVSKVFSIKFAKALVNKDEIYLMNQKYLAIQIKEMLINYDEIKKYYNQTVNIKNRLNQSADK